MHTNITGILPSGTCVRVLCTPISLVYYLENNNRLHQRLPNWAFKRPRGLSIIVTEYSYSYETQ